MYAQNTQSRESTKTDSQNDGVFWAYILTLLVYFNQTISTPTFIAKKGNKCTCFNRGFSFTVPMDQRFSKFTFLVCNTLVLCLVIVGVFKHFFLMVLKWNIQLGWKMVLFVSVTIYICLNVKPLKYSTYFHY